jgi:hypothetical protein
LETASGGRRAVRVWIPVFGGIVTWLGHLVFMASFTKYACNAHGSRWWMHLVTIGLAGLTVLAMVMCGSLIRSNRGADETDNSGVARLRFLGVAGLLIGAINLALICFEGSYVVVLRSCG